LRHLGRQHHQRKRRAQALHELDLVSRPIPEDKPSEAELFGEFYNAPITV
jgi:hypothetical protein